MFLKSFHLIKLLLPYCLQLNQVSIDLGVSQVCPTAPVQASWDVATQNQFARFFPVWLPYWILFLLKRGSNWPILCHFMEMAFSRTVVLDDLLAAGIHWFGTSSVYCFLFHIFLNVLIIWMVAKVTGNAFYTFWFTWLNSLKVFALVWFLRAKAALSLTTSHSLTHQVLFYRLVFLEGDAFAPTYFTLNWNKLRDNL